jgi:hypothetical protein
MLSPGALVNMKSEHHADRPDSEGGNAFNADGGEIQKYDVRYIVGKHVSPNVNADRIRPTTLETTLARRRPGETGTWLSLLSSSARSSGRIESASRPRLFCRETGGG